MVSFQIDPSQIRYLINKYLKHSRIFPKDMADSIIEQLNMAEQMEKMKSKKKLLINDKLFSEEQ